MGSANSVSLAYGFKIGSATDEYRWSELEVSPKAKHWFEGDMSKLIILAPSSAECTWNEIKYKVTTFSRNSFQKTFPQKPQKLWVLKISCFNN